MCLGIKCVNDKCLCERKKQKKIHPISSFKILKLCVNCIIRSLDIDVTYLSVRDSIDLCLLLFYS